MKYTKAKYSKSTEPFEFNNCFRRMFLASLFFIATMSLIGRAIYWQYDPRLALENKDNARYLRTMNIPAYHGSITDRHGTLLAVSAPVYSVWIDPLGFDNKHIDAIAEVLEIEAEEITCEGGSSRRQKISIYKAEH